MDISNVIVSYNSLKMHVTCKPTPGRELICPIYKIHFIEFQLKGFVTVNNANMWWLLVKFNKCCDDNLLYTLRVNSTELNINSKRFISDDSDWRVLGYYSTSTYNFNIEINIGIHTSSYFSLFFDDDSLTDFEIKGVDGSIRVHKIVLAAASEVFRLMITNDFKEKKQAQVELPYSKSVLQDFKEYLYLNTLNNDNLENVLLLAHCYMMYELKQDCINRLIFNITTQKSLELIEFAVVNKITELLVALLKIIQKKEVDFENYEIILPVCNESFEKTRWKNLLFCKFDIEINVQDIRIAPLLRHLVNDSLTHFEMKGIDGSVLIHGAVLATASEVFKNMVTNDFKEKKEARVELPYSVRVLQDLKDYLYLNTFNDDNLESLLTLANCYMMCRLKRICVTKMFLNIMSEKYVEKIESSYNIQKNNSNGEC